MTTSNFNIKGLSPDEVVEARKKYGSNILKYKKENSFIDAIKGISKEPMVILLFVASCIYFISGKTGDAIFLSSAIIFEITISLYQNSRSRNALDKLKDFTKPNCKVIRFFKVMEIKSDEIVIGDCILIEEGALIPADCMIIYSNDFSVNESILTGESFPVYKDKTMENNYIFHGTSVASGLAIGTVISIGNNTKLGKIGKRLESIEEEKTPLELQINNFVKKMAIAGAIVFIIVWVINYLNSYDLLDSLLKALTLAMSILPEEIPVAFTTYMAIGAWRLMKMNIVVKQMKTVETLGSATVICVDKTGTITENKMSLAKIFSIGSKKESNIKGRLNTDEIELIKIAMFASEPIPFDPMEVALHTAYSQLITVDERSEYKMIHEYPLSGKPPMMTHLFENKNNKRIIATKGAPEAIMKVCNLTKIEKQEIETVISNFSNEGYRVLAVGESNFDGDKFPENQDEFKFEFKGILAFYDPPKKNTKTVFQDFYKAGIAIKIITGDNAATTISIAKQTGFKGYENNLTGDELMNMPADELQKKVLNTNIFTRMYPDAKLKIINALKANNEIVAMTGDGVNDGPALKSAHIGIAMGKKGTEIAKQAASLILINDDLSQMVDAVGMGRRIYTNLKKAIQYIISIHIPIILVVFIPLAFGWAYPNIFSPIHIIFLELIMGPTCSIIYENEPMEKNTMIQKPRPFTNTFFNWKELATSIIQGLVISIGALSIYQFAYNKGFNESVIRTMVFIVLIAANILLTLVNRSFYYSFIETLKNKNNFVPLIISITIIINILLIYIKPLALFFEFEALNKNQLLISVGAGFLSVVWYEIIKWGKRKNNKI